MGDAGRARFEVGQVLAMDGLTASARADAVQSLEALRGAPKGLLEEMGRQPDLKALREDARFLQLLGRQ